MMFIKHVSNHTSRKQTSNPKQSEANLTTPHSSLYSQVMQLQRSIGNQRVGRMLTSQSQTNQKSVSIQASPQNVIQGKWVKDPLHDHMYFDDVYFHRYNEGTNEYFENGGKTATNPNEHEAIKLMKEIKSQISTFDPLSKVIHGHGYSNLSKSELNPNLTITLYGPYGSTLNREVSKWLRDKGPLPPGSIREITNSDFALLKKKFGGVCESFTKALWENASESEFPKVIQPGDYIPELKLDADKNEWIDPQDHVIQVNALTKLKNITKIPSEAHIHWGACLQELGKNVIEKNDITVILHPSLSKQVYPPTLEEGITEQRYQQQLLNPAHDETPDKVKPKETPATINKTFVSQGATANTQFPEDLQKTLDTEFNSEQNLDDQVVHINTLVIKYGFTRTEMLRYLGAQGKKGQLS
ncbi:hypothetical protein A8708_14310 [Paenibacillus oryzisoli]|uniref:Uncharacterized protein n=2 Tax=Paenibacillus oryzisoli TaxID=1850517 RepID=A0A198A1L0_9BACL|nr:hypothetical protein A8708_14310 [Paenibacillus oryzisoli]